MKRIKFDLIEAQQELAYARQTLVCISGMMLLNLAAAMAYKLDVMTSALVVVWLVGILAFGLAALAYSLLPIWKERQEERERLTSDNGNYVDL